MNPDDLAKLLAHFGIQAAPADATRVNQNVYKNDRTIGPATSGNIPLPQGAPPETREGWIMSHVSDMLPVVGEARGLGAAHDLARQGHPLMGAGVALAAALPMGGRLASRAVEGALPRIAKAAIKLPDGSIHWGTSHALAIDAARLEGALPDFRSPKFAKMLEQAGEGFVDEQGNYLTRDETTARVRQLLGRKVEGPGMSSEEINFMAPKTRNKVMAQPYDLPFRGERSFAATYPHQTLPDQYAILTAENPGGKPGARGANRAANAALRAELRAAGHEPIPVKGAYTDDNTGELLHENSFLVPGMTPDHAELLGRKYGQNSVVTHMGLHDLPSDKLFPSRGVSAATEAPYTELPSGGRITHDLDWDNPTALADPIKPWAPGEAQSVARPDPTVERDALFDRLQKSSGAMGDSVAVRAPETLAGVAIRDLNSGAFVHSPGFEGGHAALWDRERARDPNFGKDWLMKSGFVTDQGRFLTREEAGDLLKANRKIPSGFPSKSLTAEDLTGGEAPHTLGDSVAVRGANEIPANLTGAFDAEAQGPRNAAPSIITKPTSGDVFDTSMLGSHLPPGFTDERPPLKYPTARTDVSMFDDLDRRFRRVYTPNAERALRENPTAGGWYDTSQLRQAFMDASPTGAEDFDQFMKFMGPTSSGTTVPGNIRQASKFYELWKSGQLSLDDLKNGTLSLPPGYANRRQSSINAGIRRILEQGNLDPFTNPKTYRYSNQLAGRAWGGAALDMHVGRQVGKQGLLDTGDGQLAKAVGFPQSSYPVDRAVASSPQSNHYAVIEDALVKEAKRLGLPPAVYQAAGWVGGAKKTGVADSRNFMDLMNQILKNSAVKYNHASPLEALHAFIKGQSPLWGLVGALGLGGAAAAGGDTSK